MIFTPSPPPNSTVCDAVQALLHARPLPSPSFENTNLAGFACCTATIILGMAAWLRYRHLRRLAARSTLSSFLASSGALLYLTAGPALRDSGVYSDAEGYPQMPCLYIGVAYVVGAFTMVFTLYIRLWTTAALVHRSKLVLQYYDELDAAPLQEKVPAAETGMDHGVAVALPEKKKPCCSSLLRVACFVMWIVPSCPFSRADADVGRLLRVSREVTSGRALIALTLGAFVPCVIVVAVMVALTPAMNQRCTGCDLTWEAVISVVVVATIYALPVIPTFRALSNINNDSLGLRRELLMSMAAAFLLNPIVYTLVATDPGNMDWSFKLAWEWGITFLAMCEWGIWVPLQVALALRDERAAKSTGDSGASQASARLLRSSVFAGIRAPVGAVAPRPRLSTVARVTRELLYAHLEDDDLVAFADSCYCSESIRFLQDVQSWKRFYGDKGFAWARLKARGLAHTYIQVDAPLEINVSHATREYVLKTLTKHDIVPYEAFDQAVQEVENLLLGGIFRVFLLSKRTRRGEPLPWTSSGLGRTMSRALFKQPRNKSTGP